jgi:hypothetical protein
MKDERIKPLVTCVSLSSFIFHPSSFIKSLFSGLDALPNTGCQSTTYERTNNEYPQVGKCLSSLEQGRTDGTGRVNARAGEVDAY